MTAQKEELETFAFSADISQLMSLIINAFYSNKEIFLRELISNASDAMDKIQYKAAQSPEVLAANPKMYIKVSADRVARTVTVEDAGIAMTRSEMVNHLGTIAQSGTKAFMEAVSVGADMSMIGQFGVGFYSSYLVSEKVRVVSKSNDDPDQNIWESTAGGTFTVWKDEEFEHGVLTRGTKVICYLKDDQDDFLDTKCLKDLILKHSAFVGFPIELNMEHRTEEDVPGSEEKTVTVTHAWELINKNKPVWLRPANEVTHDEYAELYKWLASDWEDHLGVRHVDQQGQVQFKALLYCPRSAPKDMFDMGKMASRFSIRLYVRRVFIKEFNDLIPKWMGFIKGIVDSDDMPLNISREKLQQNSILKHIKAGLSKNIFQLFTEIVADKERYKTFYESFSQCLKLGVYEDHENRPQIVPLLRYYSSKSGEELVSLAEYVERMRPGQNHILYITGRNRRDAARSPYIEGLKRDGYEVLYMIDPVDEYAVQFLKEYQGKALMSAMNIDAVRMLGAARSPEEQKRELEPLRRSIEATLVARGLVDSVTLGVGMAADSVGRVQDRVLELNYKHTLVVELSKRLEKNPEVDSFATVLLDFAGLDGADSDDSRRDDASERCKDLIQSLGGADREDCDDELPDFGGEGDRAGNAQGHSGMNGARPKKDLALLSCGSLVRVVKGERSRRATIAFVDEDAGTVDVMYLTGVAGGADEEEEGVPVKAIQSLLSFELQADATAEAAQFQESIYKAGTAAKDEGNQLFKLKDFDAAHGRYSSIVGAFAARPRSRGQAVLAVSKDDKKSELKCLTLTSVDMRAEECELSNGEDVPLSSVLPVYQELLPLQCAAYMNRARCRQNLGLHREAAQDLSVVLALWACADRRMLEADLEMKEAEAKALHTALYLRARSRLHRGLVKQAAVDIKDALARNPPAATVKQIRQLKADVQVAQEQYRQINGPIVKELGRAVIAVRGGPKIS